MISGSWPSRREGTMRASKVGMRWQWIMGAAAVIACSGGEAAGPVHGTGGSTSSSGNASSGQTSASVAVASTSTGSGSNFVCDPPAAAGSIYELDAPPYHTPFDLRSMCEYRGEVMLIVNTAAL